MSPFNLGMLKRRLLFDEGTWIPSLAARDANARDTVKRWYCRKSAIMVQGGCILATILNKAAQHELVICQPVAYGPTRCG